jgi:hypothetical protein
MKLWIWLSLLAVVVCVGVMLSLFLWQINVFGTLDTKTTYEIAPLPSIISNPIVTYREIPVPMLATSAYTQRAIRSFVVPSPNGYPNIVMTTISPNGSYIAIMARDTTPVGTPDANGGRNLFVGVFTRIESTTYEDTFGYSLPISSVVLNSLVLETPKLFLEFLSDDVLVYTYIDNYDDLPCISIKPLTELNASPTLLLPSSVSSRDFTRCMLSGYGPSRLMAVYEDACYFLAQPGVIEVSRSLGTAKATGYRLLDVQGPYALLQSTASATSPILWVKEATTSESTYTIGSALTICTGRDSQGRILYSPRGRSPNEFIVVTATETTVFVRMVSDLQGGSPLLSAEVSRPIATPTTNLLQICPGSNVVSVGSSVYQIRVVNEALVIEFVGFFEDAARLSNGSRTDKAFDLVMNLSNTTWSHRVM